MREAERFSSVNHICFTPNDDASRLLWESLHFLVRGENRMLETPMFRGPLWSI